MMNPFFITSLLTLITLATHPGFGAESSAEIVNKMIEAHGGQLWATSNVGEGTTFHFTLPTTREEHGDNVERNSLCHR